MKNLSIGRLALLALLTLSLYTLRAVLFTPAQAQTVQYSAVNPLVPGHLGMWIAPGAITDAGGAAGAPPGLSPTELSLTLPTFSPTLGPNGENFVDWSAPVGSARNYIGLVPKATIQGVTGTFITIGSQGGASALSPFLLINGSIFPLGGGGGGGNVTGQTPTISGELASFKNTGGTLIGQGAATLTDNRATVTTDAAALAMFSNLGIPTANTIYNWAFGGGASTYDVYRSTIQLNAGSTTTGLNNFGAYLDNELASLSGNSRNGVNYFGVAVAGVNNSWSWGVNTICTDSKTQTASALTGVNCLGYEPDFNIWATGTIVNGIELVGNSGAQPTVANGFVVNTLDISGLNRAHWSTGFIAASGATSQGLLLGQTTASGTNINSATINLNVFDAGGLAKTAQIQATPTGLVFTHTMVAASFYAFDAPIEISGGAAYEINFDNVVGADSLHNVSFGSGLGLATITFGNNTAPIIVGAGASIKFQDLSVTTLDYAVTTAGTWTFGSAVPVVLQGTLTLATSSTGASTQTFTNSPCVGLTTEKWIPVKITGQTGTWNIPACQ